MSMNEQGGFDNIRDAGLGDFIGARLLDVTSKLGTPEEFLAREEGELDMVYFHFDNGRSVGVVLRPETLMLDPDGDDDEE